MNFLIPSQIFLPHNAALCTDDKSSDSNIISEASLAKVHPEPIQNPTFAVYKAYTSLSPSAVTATIAPNSFRPTIKAYLSSGVDLANTFNL